MELDIRDLQYISISQYIDTLVEYRIVIRCSMNIKIFDSAEQCMFHVVNITFLCVQTYYCPTSNNLLEYL